MATPKDQLIPRHEIRERITARENKGNKEELQRTLLQVQCLQALERDVPKILRHRLETLYIKVFE